MKAVDPITCWWLEIRQKMNTHSLLIDISHLQELKTNVLDQNFVVGAGFTLTEFLSILKANSTLEYFNYFEKLHEHISLVAHIPVRNVGTIAGNLMIKHKYNVFQSDIFLLLETVGAQLNIINCYGQVETHTMQSFLRVNMNQKVILNVLLPPLSNEYKLITFKIMPRAQSVHAIVNAGFLYEIDKQTQIVKQARIVYGALSPNFIRACATESFLVGKQLFTNQTLQAALGVLDGELIVEENPPEPSVAYRKQLAKALFYKALLTISPPTVRTSRFKSATIKLHESRGVSDGRQFLTTDPTKWPLTQPIQKVEGLYQSAGEAIYTDDMPKFPNEVFGAFVLSTVATGTIVNIDATNAMTLKGVVAFYTAKDIPGLNSFTPADSLHIADRATKLVKVKYSNVKKPVLDVKRAKEDSTRNTLFFSSDATNRGTDVHKVITGNTTAYGQYHFTMETLVTVAKPTEEGLEVHSATQWLDGSHVMISRALGIDQNRIDMHLRRIGGAYGMKISRSIQSAVACSLVCLKLNRPCRFIQPLTTNMQAVGKRLPFSNDYEVAVNKSGVIQYINETMYEDNGYKRNEILSTLGTGVYNNCYDATKFNYKVFDTITETAKNSWCRAPGTLEAIAACEYIMERIAYELSLDPIAVRLANLDTEKYNVILEMIQQFKIDAEYDTRRAAVDSFNTENRWKKRGLRFSFARWDSNRSSAL
ncbi:unnamed protein product [Arctia plantaginis]|uniref:FAD-binding PCMH-type domain-containing protein n=1 Tax=Arctia plantaginis TaxID=874455 RepID=A0A8S0Z5G7_ARCPL|nr:unnamed protein product [Arctia plantaginis]